jgi:rod shape-determining protein MreD
MPTFLLRFILVVATTFAGTSLLAPLRIYGCDLDLELLILVLISKYCPPSSTVGWSAFSGFLLDCLNPQWMGIGTGARATAGFFLTSMREKLNIDHPFLDGAVVFVACFIDRAIYLSLSEHKGQFFYGLIRYAAPSALYNALFAVVVILLYRFRKNFAGNWS